MLALGVAHCRILQLGDPELREISQPVTAVEADPVFRDLRDTLHEFRRTHGFGRGISAIQIGVRARLIYIEFEGHAYRLRNPVMDPVGDATFELWDDCFSFPNLLVRLRRWQTVRLRWETDSGETTEIEASGALSELIQHEMDHLDGILAVDRALDRDSFATREEYERRYLRHSNVSDTLTRSLV